MFSIQCVYQVKEGECCMQIKLRGLRAEHGLTQADMADLIGITRQTYSEKELGNQSFKAEEMFIISAYFDKPIESIFLSKKYTNRIQRNKQGV